MDKDKLTLLGGGALLVLGMAGTGVFLFTDVLEPKTGTEPVPVVQKKVEKTEVQEKLAKGETVTTPYTSLITPVGYGDKEFPVEQSQTFKEQLLREAEGGEVDALMKEVEKKLAGFRFSQEKNLEIAGLYADASFVRGLVDKSTDEMSKALPGGFKTPEMLAIMPLYFPEEARRALFHDTSSLTPLNPGPWMIKDHRTITTKEEADMDESYQDNGVAISMFNVIDGLHQIHVIELVRDEEPDVPVRAYISELNNGKLKLYGYFIPDDVTHYYKDVAFFEELDEMYLNPNDEYQQEQIQKEIDEGNIPEEALDQFLNPTE